MKTRLVKVVGQKLTAAGQAMKTQTDIQMKNNNKILETKLTNQVNASLSQVRGYNI